MTHPESAPSDASFFGPWDEIRENIDYIAYWPGAVLCPTIMDDSMGDDNFDRIRAVFGHDYDAETRDATKAARRRFMATLLSESVEGHLIVDETGLGHVTGCTPAAMLSGLTALRSAMEDTTNNTEVHILPTQSDPEARARSVIVEASDYMVIDSDKNRRILIGQGTHQLDPEHYPPDQSMFRLLSFAHAIHVGGPTELGGGRSIPSNAWTGARAIELVNRWQEHFEQRA